VVDVAAISDWVVREFAGVFVGVEVTVVEADPLHPVATNANARKA
jgi:hypothetical protein